MSVLLAAIAVSLKLFPTRSDYNRCPSKACFRPLLFILYAMLMISTRICASLGLRMKFKTLFMSDKVMTNIT